MNQHSLTNDEINAVKNERKEIKAKNYDIGDVSPLMKRLVNEVYGDDDWSTCGFWMNAVNI